MLSTIKLVVNNKQRGFHLVVLAMALVVTAVVVMAGIFVWTRTHQRFADGKISAKDAKSLPDISYFETHKSDQFIVDMSLVQTGFPYKGKRANSPHTGAHVQFGDDYKDWPKGGTAPENYPAVYSPVDGVVANVTNTFTDPSKQAGIDLYNLDIAFAKSGNDSFTLFYSFEPFVKEPSPGFYAKFIDVKKGDHVKKGQIIAHMYLSPQAKDIEHIHFNLSRQNGNGNTLLPPAIFTKAIVDDFYDHWGSFGVDDIHNDPNGPRIPACMGYKLTAQENPFGTGAVDCLN